MGVRTVFLNYIPVVIKRAVNDDNYFVIIGVGAADDRLYTQIEMFGLLCM